MLFKLKIKLHHQIIEFHILFLVLCCEKTFNNIAHLTQQLFSFINNTLFRIPILETLLSTPVIITLNSCSNQ